MLVGGDKTILLIRFLCYLVAIVSVLTPSREEKGFLYFNHLSKEFLEQMIPHLKALIYGV